jgi:hypothetical protein
MQITLERYTDPDRKSLAKSAAVYLGKTDYDNIKRPLGIIRQHHTLAIFRGEHARFHFKDVSKVVYDHLITYTTAEMRACGGLRANEAQVFIPPVEDNDPIYAQIGMSHLRDYSNLVHGIDPNTDDPIKKKRLQAARSVAPTSVGLTFMFQWNFATLIEAIFPQRLWTPGAQPDTRAVVQTMFDLVREQDLELWDLVYEMYGPESQSWKQLRRKLKKENFDLYKEIMQKYGNMKSMWD